LVDLLSVIVKYNDEAQRILSMYACDDEDGEGEAGFETVYSFVNKGEYWEARDEKGVLAKIDYDKRVVEVYRGDNEEFNAFVEDVFRGDDDFTVVEKEDM